MSFGCVLFDPVLQQLFEMVSPHPRIEQHVCLILIDSTYSRSSLQPYRQSLHFDPASSFPRLDSLDYGLSQSQVQWSPDLSYLGDTQSVSYSSRKIQHSSSKIL